MLKSEVFRNRRLVKDRRRSKRLKKQSNFRTKTYKGKVAFQELSKDSDKRRKKQQRKKRRKEIRDEYGTSDRNVK